MSAPEIPWNGPSRYGRAGLAARRLIRRAVRPVSVRIEAEQHSLQDQVAAQREQSRSDLDAANAELALLRRQVVEGFGSLQDQLNRHREFSTASARVLDDVLARDLAPGGRVHRVRHDHPRGAICSMGSGPYRGLLSRTAISFECYARRWGWDLILSAEDLADGAPAPWGKLPLLRELLDAYEWVVWLDADVVIVDLAADISAEFRDGKDLYLVEHSNTQHQANSGVMALRSSDWTRRFLAAAWGLRDTYRDHHLWENAAVLELLGYAPAPWRLVTPTTWLERTRFLDVRWNSVETHRADPPVIVHRGFHHVDRRCEQVAGDLACVLAGAHPLTAGWDRPARPVQTVADLRRREELPLMLNAMGLTGVGAEVGVRKGQFSEHILEHWDGERLISIDPWRAAPADQYRDIANTTQSEQDGNLAETEHRLRRFGGRSTIWRRTSLTARPLLRPDSLDFVYLDARHDEASVHQDLSTWWPVVRPGGVLCGHDYVDGVLPQGVFGVRSAVDGFFAERGIPVHVTVDDPPFPTWIAVKPGAGLVTNAAMTQPGSTATGIRAIDQVLADLADGGAFTVVQIGAFRGQGDSDPLFAFLRQELPEHPGSVALLIEPVREYFEDLAEVYRGVPGVRLENVAIAEAEGERDLYRLAIEPDDEAAFGWLSQVGSLREDRMTALWGAYEQKIFENAGIVQNYEGFWHEHQIVERVACTTLPGLLERHDIATVDLLQIDTEGYDHVILQTIDFSVLRPRFINYERVLMNADEQGTLRALLESAGYHLYDWGQDTLCVLGT